MKCMFYDDINKWYSTICLGCIHFFSNKEHMCEFSKDNSARRPTEFAPLSSDDLRSICIKNPEIIKSFSDDIKEQLIKIHPSLTFFINQAFNDPSHQSSKPIERENYDGYCYEEFTYKSV